MVVYRLGAGLHGLGRRGWSWSLVGGGLLAVTLPTPSCCAATAPRSWSTRSSTASRWAADNLGAFPRPIEALLGVPALVWGCHMRARRRQGWWVCAFGVAATAPVANSAARHPVHPGPTEAGPGRGSTALVVGLGWLGAGWP